MAFSLLVGLLCCHVAAGARVDVDLEFDDIAASHLSMENYDASVAESEMEIETATALVSRATTGVIESLAHEAEALVQYAANATHLVLDGRCTNEDMQFFIKAGPGHHQGSLGWDVSTCGGKSWSVWSGFRQDLMADCMQNTYRGLTRPCAECYGGARAVRLQQLQDGLYAQLVRSQVPRMC